LRQRRHGVRGVLLQEEHETVKKTAVGGTGGPGGRRTWRGRVSDIQMWTAGLPLVLAGHQAIDRNSPCSIDPRIECASHQAMRVIASIRKRPTFG
jgi:hypothetical protein